MGKIHACMQMKVGDTKLIQEAYEIQSYEILVMYSFKCIHRLKDHLLMHNPPDISLMHSPTKTLDHILVGLILNQSRIKKIVLSVSGFLSYIILIYDPQTLF